MREFFLQKLQRLMNAIVLDARSKLDALLVADLRGANDMLPAIERLAKRFRLPSSAPLKALRYRPPKRLDAELYLKLCVAYYEGVRTKSLKFHGDEKNEEAPQTLVGRYLAGLAAAVDRATFGPVDDEDQA